MDINIYQLLRIAPDDVVVRVYFIAKLEQGEHVAKYNTSLIFNERDPSDPNFIPFNQLTEEVVKQWIIEKAGTELEAHLQNELDKLTNPTEIYGLPWQ